MELCLYNRIVSYLMTFIIISIVDEYLLSRRSCSVLKDPDNIWKVATSLQRFDHSFNLSIEYIDGKTKKSQEEHITQ